MCSEHCCILPSVLFPLQLGAAGGFCLHPDQVFLLSARDALLARLVLAGRAQRADCEAFMQKAFGRRWSRVRDEGEVREEAAAVLEVRGWHRLAYFVWVLCLVPGCCLAY